MWVCVWIMRYIFVANHHSTVVLKCLREVFIWVPTMPRALKYNSLSDNGCDFVPVCRWCRCHLEPNKLTKRILFNKVINIDWINKLIPFSASEKNANKFFCQQILIHFNSILLSKFDSFYVLIQILFKFFCQNLIHFKF